MDVQMVVPFRERCGINDYTRTLLECLPGRPGLRHELNPAHPPCDILHVQFEPVLFRRDSTSSFPVLKKCRARARVVTVHEVYESNPYVSPMPVKAGPYSALRRLKYRFTHRLVLREETFTAQNYFADAVVVHTRQAAGLLSARGADSKRIHVIPHPVFTPASGVPVQSAGPGPKKKILVFGFISPANDYSMLFSAFSGLRDRARLILAGSSRRPEDSELDGDLAAEIQRRGLACDIERIGYVESAGLPALFAGADLFVSPALIKTGSGTLARALGAGLPSIAPDLPYVHEINAAVPGCVAAYRPGDAAALSRAMETLLEDAALGAARGRVRAYAEKHSFAAFAEAHVQLYRRLLEDSV